MINRNTLIAMVLFYLYYYW